MIVVAAAGGGAEYEDVENGVAVGGGVVVDAAIAVAVGGVVLSYLHAADYYLKEFDGCSFVAAIGGLIPQLRQVGQAGQRPPL